jgi:hypothetical protein
MVNLMEWIGQGVGLPLISGLGFLASELSATTLEA